MTGQHNLASPGLYHYLKRSTADLYLDLKAEDDLGEEKVPLLRFSAVLALAMPALTLALGGGGRADFFDLLSSFFFSLLREDSVVGIWKAVVAL